MAFATARPAFAQFSGPTNFGTPVYVGSMSFGDVDNDGDLDFIATGTNAGVYRLDKYINIGGGSFTGPNAFGTGV